MSPSEYNKRGTVVTLHIAEDSKEFLDKYELRKILEKYCAFLPVEVYLEDVEEEAEKAKKAKAVSISPLLDSAIDNLSPPIVTAIFSAEIHY
jgi:molecular chaperone HtpG